VLFDYRDISFSVPVRKKLRLEGLIGGIRGSDAQGNAEVNLTWETIGMLISQPTCLKIWGETRRKEANPRN
jgi:hypothetical protein